MDSGQTDTEAVYREVVGEGFTPPEENETGKNGRVGLPLGEEGRGRDVPSAH